MQTLNRLTFYLVGFAAVFARIFVVTILVVWVLKAASLIYGFDAIWEQVSLHVFLSLSFCVFFPGQTFWTYRREDSDGVLHTIVGVEDPSGTPVDDT